MTDDEKAVAAHKARHDLYFYSRLQFRERKGIRWQRAAHHRKVCDALMRVFNGQCSRLLLHLPPRYSKTELAVINFIAWALGKVPDAEFLHVSYSGELAVGNSWAVRESVQTRTHREIFPECLLDPTQRARDNWRTTAGGAVYAAGFDGTLTGKGAGKMREPGPYKFGGAIVIDDPHKAGEALSETVRKGVQTGFSTTIESRKNTQDTPIIVVMQRLHEDDLAGWLAAGGNGEKWEIVSIPVFEEMEDGSDGPPIWPEKHSAEVLAVMEATTPYVFAGQYRQRPAPPAGGNIKPGMIEVVRALPAGRWSWVRGWDLAASKNSGAWTVGALLGRHLDSGRTAIADIVRDRVGPDGVRAMILNTARRDGMQVLTSIPQDPGQAGKVQVLDLARMLNGHRVTFSPETGDKVTRADPFASQVNVGNVMMLEAPWNNAFVAEAATFPNGFKDQIDACSRAFSEMDDSMARFRALAGG